MPLSPYWRVLVDLVRNPVLIFRIIHCSGWVVLTRPGLGNDWSLSEIPQHPPEWQKRISEQMTAIILTRATPRDYINNRSHLT